MARKFLKRYTPDPEWIKKQPSLRMLGDWLHDPNIWHLNKSSVAKAAFIGLFVAFLPLPTQMIFAGLLAVIFRANLPLSVILVWITNPFTMAPIFYLTYKVGSAIMDTPPNNFNFELSWEWLIHGLAANWQPFIICCLVCGIFFGLLGSAIARWAWRMHTLYRWHERQIRRNKGGSQ